MNHSRINALVILFLFLVWAAAGCVPGTPETAPPVTVRAMPAEVPVVLLPLDGPVANSRAEVSGMGWYGDDVVILPQYPHRFEGGPEGALFTLSREEVVAFLEGRSGAGALTPAAVPFHAPGVREAVEGFEGYESITFVGDQVYLTIEASPDGEMVGYLVTGHVEPGMAGVHVDSGTLVEIPPQADLSNMTDESVLFVGDALLTFYEANGAHVNPRPVAHRYSMDAAPLAPIAFPTLEYRVTDATAVDAEGRFWVTNYFWPGDGEKLDPAADALAQRFGRGATHADSEIVERLVEMRYTGTDVVLTERAPIQLALEGGEARNWEAVVRLADRGFLLMTDTHPETLLGFVPWAPEGAE